MSKSGFVVSESGFVVVGFVSGFMASGLACVRC